MIRARRYNGWINGRLCDECRREWNEIIRHPDDGPDPRGYVHLFGALGRVTVDVTLCPQCAEDVMDVIASGVDLAAVLRKNRAYDDEEALGVLLGRLPIRFAEEDEPSEVPANVLTEDQFTTLLEQNTLRNRWWNRGPA